MRSVTTVISVMALSAGAALGTETSVPFINADDVHAQGITGRGVTVAVIGVGFDYGHPGLIGDIRPGGISLIDGTYVGDGGAALPGFTHGTHMALIITDTTGVAPDAYVLPVRVYDASSQTPPQDIITAIRYVTERREVDPSIRVINLSLSQILAYSCSCDANFLQLAAAISDAAAAGIVTFAATGNSAFCGLIRAPACVSSTVRVVASYDGDYGGLDFVSLCTDPATLPYRVTCFSDIAEDCDYLLAAPGYDITVGGISNWGTSQATAHCSGVAALMFEKNICGLLDAYSARTTIFNTAAEHDFGFPYCGLPPQARHVNALAAVNAVAAGACGAVGDLDCDGTVSLYDFALFLECLLGPGAGAATGWCACADSNGSRSDGDVDLRDFAEFQVAFTGWGDGACCHADSTCTEGTLHECDAAGAYYQGHATTCAAVECPLPNWGACCDPDDETCTESTEEDCVWGWGLYQGHGTSCPTATCPTGRYRNTIDPLLVYIPSGPGRQIADDITLSGSGGGDLVFYDLGLYGGGGGNFDVTAGLYTNCPGNGGTLIAGTEFTWLDNFDGASPNFLQATFDPPVTIPHSFWMVVTFSTSQAGWFRAEEAEVGFTANVFGMNDPPWVCNYWWGPPPNPHAGFWANVGCVAP